VKLAGPDSPVRGELAMLEEGGVDLVPCGTCLEFYGVEPAVGGVGSMDEIIHTLKQAEKVITI
ncbi:MAG: sulfurtransferase-like selenium metabolism protein YedF, partial [Planctomycetota bacterium]